MYPFVQKVKLALVLWSTIWLSCLNTISVPKYIFIKRKIVGGRGKRSRRREREIERDWILCLLKNIKRTKLFYLTLFVVHMHILLVSGWQMCWWHNGTSAFQIHHIDWHKLYSFFLLLPSSIPLQWLDSLLQTVLLTLILHMNPYQLPLPIISNQDYIRTYIWCYIHSQKAQ